MSANSIVYIRFYSVLFIYSGSRRPSIPDVKPRSQTCNGIELYTPKSSRSRTNSNDSFIRSGSHGSANRTTIDNFQGYHESKSPSPISPGNRRPSIQDNHQAMMEPKRSNAGNSSRSRTNSNESFIRSGSHGSANSTTINNVQLGERTNSNHSIGSSSFGDRRGSSGKTTNVEQIYENVKTDNTLL